MRQRSTGNVPGKRERCVELFVLFFFPRGKTDLFRFFLIFVCLLLHRFLLAPAAPTNVPVARNGRATPAKNPSATRHAPLTGSARRQDPASVMMGSPVKIVTSPCRTGRARAKDLRMSSRGGGWGYWLWLCLFSCAGGQSGVHVGAAAKQTRRRATLSKSPC